MIDVVVAAVNMRCVPGQIQENLDNLERWCIEAKSHGADIVCSPEMSICGYDPTQKIRTFAEPIPGPSTDRVVKLAQELDLTILAGLAEESAQGDLYITQFIAASSGIVGTYRKVHLGPTERVTFRPGDRIEVFHHEKCSMGLQICYDGHFPEISTVQALQGAEVIFIPHATPRETPQEKRDRMVRYLPARAYDNACYVVTCNHVGQSHSDRPLAGVALVIDPRGEIITEKLGWDEGMVVATLEAEIIRRIKESEMGWFLSSRRPELYGDLCRSEKILV